MTNKTPPHYPQGGVDFMDKALKWGWYDAYRFNICKYGMRAGLKEGEPILKDLRKCKDYIDRWIKHEEDKQND